MINTLSKLQAKPADFARSASGCVAAHCAVQFSGGITTLPLIAVLATPLLQYCLNLSVIPPDCGTDCDKGKEAQSIFINARVRMGSLLLFHIAQMPVADVPDRNRCRLHRDNAR